MPYQLAEKYQDKSLPPPEPTDPIPDVSSYYNVLVDEFLDDVFGYDSRLSRTEWEETVALKQSYIFCATDVRQKLMDNIK